MGLFDGRTRIYKFELFLRDREEAVLWEEIPVASFKEAWCEVEALALQSPDPHGLIHVTDKDGHLLIVSGVSIALGSIAECKIATCSLKAFMAPTKCSGL